MPARSSAACRGCPAARGRGRGLRRPAARPRRRNARNSLTRARCPAKAWGRRSNKPIRRKLDVKIACRLFRNYIATEAKMLRALDTNGPSLRRAAADQSSRCAGATPRPSRSANRSATPRPADRPRPRRHLSDALGTSPTLPQSRTREGLRHLRYLDRHSVLAR